jgi:hypothetical protein
MAHFRYATAAALAILATPACKQPSNAPAPASAPAPSRPPAAPQSQPAPADPEAATELIVGSARGLEAWRRDGSGKRMISAGPALHPRWLDTSSVIALRASGDDLAKGGRLEKISLSDGKRTRVALLPPFACARPAPDPDAGVDAEPDDTLELQDESDFQIDRDAHRASLTIMDRNTNMADIILDLRVDLTTGKVERWLSQGGDEHPCAAPAGVNAGKPPDEPPRARAALPKPPAAAAAFRFSFQQEAIVEGSGAKPVLRVPGYDSESTSPSGRWALLGGDVSEGDYIHRSLVLLDRTTGDLFPIRQRGGAWPPALPRPAAAPGKPAPKLKLPVPRTIEAVGETDTRWLGTTAASELLVIDKLVVRPGAASFSVNGRLAR